MQRKEILKFFSDACNYKVLQQQQITLKSNFAASKDKTVYVHVRYTRIIVYNLAKCDFKVLINALLMWPKKCSTANSNEKKTNFPTK